MQMTICMKVKKQEETKLLRRIIGNRLEVNYQDGFYINKRKDCTNIQKNYI